MSRERMMSDSVEVNISFTLIGISEVEFKEKLYLCDELQMETDNIRDMLKKFPFNVYTNCGVMIDIRPCNMFAFIKKHEDLP
jgi:hypothetical protein